MKLNPYLFFNGNCEEAMNFYKSCLGGEFDSINYFKDGPNEIGGKKITPELHGKVMHLTWRFGENVVMASDRPESSSSESNISLSISMSDPNKMEIIFNRMAVDGHVTMPMNDTFWGARFGMFTDKYGINWMFNCQIEGEEG